MFFSSIVTDSYKSAFKSRVKPLFKLGAQPFLLAELFKILLKIKFSKTLEDVCINCVETGSMTKDLAILIDKNQKYLTTNQFLDTIDGNLKKKLN